MVISDLTGLPPADEIGFIINVGTKYVSTLALLSALRYARIPIVVIDCESRDGSFDWFLGLMKDYDFHLIAAKLRHHGETLDWIFKNVRSDRVLLIDSDTEMLNSAMLDQMRRLLQSSDRLYGSGFLHPAQWLEHHYFTTLPIAPGIGYYMERMWIPFTLLRVKPVIEALRMGKSFMHRLVLNEAAGLPLLSNLLWRRFRMEIFRRRRLSWLDPLRKTFNGEKPCYVSYDTGADLHEFLTKDRSFRFDGVEAGAIPWSVTHFSGVTRSELGSNASYNRDHLRTTHPIIVDRLRVYGIQC